MKIIKPLRQNNKFRNLKKENLFIFLLASNGSGFEVATQIEAATQSGNSRNRGTEPKQFGADEVVPKILLLIT